MSRAALEWCFGENGNVSIGVELAAAAAPVFLAMSLLIECQRWSERALLALDEAKPRRPRGNAASGGLGNFVDVHARQQRSRRTWRLNRSLEIAEERSDALNVARMLGMLHLYHLRGGDYRLALRYAGAQLRGSPADLATRGLTALAHSLLGISRHLMGDLNGARVELEAAT